MKKRLYILIIGLLLGTNLMAQIIPLDTTNWEFQGNYIIEDHKGKRAVYSQGGSMKLKNQTFLNGTIEFDLFLKEDQMFPGIYFRAKDNDGEQFYIRPHLSGKPDANQAIPLVNGVSPWQLYFGPKYSFPYEYKYDDWTHVKIVVNGDKAQVFLDYADQPNLSWYLTIPPTEGEVIIRGGGRKAIHVADVKIDKDATDLINFEPIEREPLENLINEWSVSDMFEEKLLDDLDALESLIENRKWEGKIEVEEGTAANISRHQMLYDGNPGNTVFTKVTIVSDQDQTKLFEFGYSDRVVAVLNGKPIYRGTNRWRSRDYRYLGTVGLFDAIYLNLKKGKNTLLMAVSEDFGGWLITGRFKNNNGLKIK